MDSSSAVKVEATGAQSDAFSGRYQVIRLLGRGGMGSVFLVRDFGRNRQLLALKRFRRDRVHPRYLAFLRNEFLYLAAVEHPNLTQVFDFGVDQETGQFFFTSEFVDGENLLEATRRLTLSDRNDLETFLELLAQLLRALEFIHNRGMIYGDIKPDNILVGSYDHQRGRLLGGQVKFIDFGLIRPEKQHRATRAFGTPAYVAPETVLGAATDRRADLYSLGVLLYELATGKLPFPGNTNLEILRGHVEKRPTPPHIVSPHLPQLFSALVMRLLEKKPEDRFANALEFLDEINRVFDLSIPL